MPKIINSALLDSIRKPSDMVDDMLDKQLETLEANLGKKAKGIGNHLMSLLVQNGNRIQWEEQALVGEMIKVTALDATTLREVLITLREGGIIRQTVGGRYEIANSFLARRANQKIEADNRVLRGIQTSIHDYQSRGALLDEKYINYIDSSISLNLLTDRERQFVEESRESIKKGRRLNILLISLAFILLAAMTFTAFRNYNKAKVNNEKFQEYTEKLEERGKELTAQKERAELAEHDARLKAEEAETARQNAEQARKDALAFAKETEALRRIAIADRDSIYRLNEQTAAQAAILQDLSEEAQQKAEAYKALSEVADKRAAEARIAQQKAEQYNRIITSWNAANRALQIEDSRTKALVAMEAYNINKRYPELGNIYHPNIVKALFDASCTLTPQLIFNQKGYHKGGIQAISFRPQLDRFYTTGEDGKLMQWDIKQWNTIGSPQLKAVQAMNIPVGKANQVLALSPSGDFVLIGGQGPQLTVVNTFNGRTMASYSIANQDEVYTAKWLNDEQFMVAGNTHFYTYKEGEGFLAHPKMTSNVNWIGNRGNSLVGYTFRGELRDYAYRVAIDSIQDKNRGKREVVLGIGSLREVDFGMLSNLKVHKRQDGRDIYAFGFSNGRIIIAANEPGDPQFLSLLSNEKKVFKLYQSAISALDFNLVDDFLAVGNLEGTVSLWDLNRYTEPSYQPMVYAGQADGILSLKFSPDGRFILAGDRKGDVYFWNVHPDAYAEAICEELNKTFDAYQNQQTEMNKVLKRSIAPDLRYDHLSDEEYIRYFEGNGEEGQRRKAIQVCNF